MLDQEHHRPCPPIWALMTTPKIKEMDNNEEEERQLAHLRSYQMSCSVLSSLIKCSACNLPRAGASIISPTYNAETEAEKGKVTWAKSQSQKVVKSEFKLAYTNFILHSTNVYNSPLLSPCPKAKF